MYCYVENNKIIKGPQELPRHWLNMMNFYLISNPEDYGWYPFIDNGPPEWNRATKICSSEIQINSINKTVERVYTVRNLTSEELNAEFVRVKDEKLRALSQIRWQKETGGVTIAPGVVVRTDEVSQAKLTGMVNLFTNDPTLTSIDWEAQPGVWTTINANTAIAIGVSVGRHIQACFSHARTLSEQIQAANTVNAINSIDITAGWPS